MGVTPSRGRPREHVDAPGGKIDVEPRIAHAVALPLEDGGGEGVLEGPGSATQAVDRHAHLGLRRRARQVDHDEAAGSRALPAPRHDVHVASVVRPAGALAQPPDALAYAALPQSVEEPAIERDEIVIDGLLWTARQKDGEPDAPSL